MKETWAAKGGRPDSQDWFRKGGATGVLKVPNTPQQSLKEKVERVLENVPGPKDQNLKVIEKPGLSVRRVLCKNNPLPRADCQRRSCPLRDQANGCREKCQTESVGYIARCKRCWEVGEDRVKKVYVGESSRSVYTRANGHYTDLKSKIKTGKGTSWMADHIKEVHGGMHNGKEPWEDWLWSLNGSYRKALDRQLSEFSAIRRVKTQGVVQLNGKETKISKELFNSKEEWFSHVGQWDIV